MQPRALLAAVLLAAPLVGWNVSALGLASTDAPEIHDRLIATAGFVHDRPGVDTATCSATAPAQTSCNTGDFSCIYDQTQNPWTVRCWNGFHTNGGASTPFNHGVPTDCCPGFNGRVQSVVTHSGGQSIVQCDIRQVNGTLNFRNCSGPMGPPPPASLQPSSMAHACTSSNFLSNAGTGSGPFRCFITHP